MRAYSIVFAICACMLASASRAYKDFLEELLHEDPGDNMKNINLLEYYGRIDWADQTDGELARKNANSVAFLTMLMSYEYQSKTIRFHFNMKEPARRGNAFLAETDMQWNTYLDLNDKEDADFVFLQEDER